MFTSLSRMSGAILIAFMFLLLPILSMEVDSQGRGEMGIDSDIEELGFSGVSGSGKVTWRLDGKVAQDLRRMIIQKYDSNIGLPPLVGRGNADGSLDADELENYKRAIDSYLMNMPYNPLNCDDCHGSGPVSYFGAEITVAQLYHKEPGSTMGQAIQVDMKGLLNTRNSSTDDIAIYYKFEVTTYPTRQDFPMDSDALANALYAPFNTTYQGAVSHAHLQVIVGYQSYQEFRMPHGSMFMLRTPAGEALWYSTSFHTSSMGNERAVFMPFDFLENPQVLFVLMVIVAHYTTALPNMLFFRFRSSLPRAKQSLAKRVKWIHYLATVLVILQIVLYFVPFLGPLFISGAIYWILSIAMMGGVSFLAHQRYFKRDLPRIQAMPMPERAGPPARAPAAAAPDGEAAAPIEDMLEVPCIHCASLLRFPAGANTECVLCRECGLPQMEFSPGYSYLIIEDVSKLTYGMFASLVARGRPGMFTSANFPKKIMKEHKFTADSSIWITDSGTADDAINPLRLEFEITRDITKFVKKNPECVVLLDGVNYLILTNGFEKVFRFIKKLIDLASTTSTMLLAVISKKTLSEEQADSLRREFDTVVDLSLCVKAEVLRKGRPGIHLSKAPIIVPRSSPEPEVKRRAPPPPPPEKGGGVLQPSESVVIPEPEPERGHPPPSPSPPVKERTPPKDRRARLKKILEKKGQKPAAAPKGGGALLSTSPGGVQCAHCRESVNKDDWMIACSCGGRYHTKCASGSTTCGICGSSLTPS